MSVNAQKWAWDQGPRHELSQVQVLLLVRIADHADNDGVCWPGNNKLAHYCRADESTVRRNLRQLEDKDLLHRERRVPKAGRGRAFDSIVLHMDQPGRAPGESQGVSQTGTATPSPPDQPGTPPASSETTNRAMKNDQPGDDAQTNRAMTNGLYVDEPKENPQEPKEQQGSPDFGTEWQEWLSDFREVTGHHLARGSETARSAFVARRREGWSLDDLKLATRGNNADRWRRQNGHNVPDTILRASHAEGYFLAGQALRQKAAKREPERVAL